MTTVTIAMLDQLFGATILEITEGGLERLRLKLGIKHRLSFSATHDDKHYAKSIRFYSGNQLVAEVWHYIRSDEDAPFRYNRICFNRSFCADDIDFVGKYYVYNPQGLIKHDPVKEEPAMAPITIPQLRELALQAVVHTDRLEFGCGFHSAEYRVEYEVHPMAGLVSLHFLHVSEMKHVFSAWASMHETQCSDRLVLNHLPKHGAHVPRTGLEMIDSFVVWDPSQLLDRNTVPETQADEGGWNLSDAAVLRAITRDTQNRVRQGTYGNGNTGMFGGMNGNPGMFNGVYQPQFGPGDFGQHPNFPVNPFHNPAYPQPYHTPVGPQITRTADNTSGTAGLHKGKVLGKYVEWLKQTQPAFQQVMIAVQNLINATHGIQRSPDGFLYSSHKMAIDDTNDKHLKTLNKFLELYAGNSPYEIEVRQLPGSDLTACELFVSFG